MNDDELRELIAERDQLKAELREWRGVFGHLGNTPDDIGNLMNEEQDRLKAEIERLKLVIQDRNVEPAEAGNTIHSLRCAQLAQQQVVQDAAGWLWNWLMDYCKRNGHSPAARDDLFEAVSDMREWLAASKPIQQEGE